MKNTSMNVIFAIFFENQRIKWTFYEFGKIDDKYFFL